MILKKNIHITNLDRKNILVILNLVFYFFRDEIENPKLYFFYSTTISSSLNIVVRIILFLFFEYNDRNEHDKINSHHMRH